MFFTSRPCVDIQSRLSSIILVAVICFAFFRIKSGYCRETSNICITKLFVRIEHIAKINVVKKNG